jgi:hypothetical protein
MSLPARLLSFAKVDEGHGGGELEVAAGGETLQLPATLVEVVIHAERVSFPEDSCGVFALLGHNLVAKANQTVVPTAAGKVVDNGFLLSAHFPLSLLERFNSAKSVKKWCRCL